jgi:signal transduction histidine kinase
MRLVVYWIIQEAMTNIVKHTQATEVNIRFEKDGHRAILEIQDNGAGFQISEDWLPLVRHSGIGSTEHCPGNKVGLSVVPVNREPAVQ